jgi:hypothetical protein
MTMRGSFAESSAFDVAACAEVVSFLRQYIEQADK